jgi:hypothetical protein
MNETVHFVARHGYWLLVGAVLGRVAVGTTVARRPPHSPVLALLTHTVLTLDLGIFGVETHSRIRLQDLDRRQEAAQAFLKAVPA